MSWPGRNNSKITNNQLPFYESPGSLTIEKDEFVIPNTAIINNLYVKNLHGGGGGGGAHVINGTFTVNGDSALNGTLTVAGKTIFIEDVSMSGDLAVNGDASFNNVAIHGTLTYDHLFEDFDSITVREDASLNRLTVMGDASFNSDVSFNSGVVVAGKTIFIEDVSMSGDLAVNGNGFFNGNFSVKDQEYSLIVDATSEWNNVANLPPSGQAQGMAMSSDGQYQILTESSFGQNGNIWYSSDYGLSWTENTTSPGLIKPWAGCASSADGTRMVAVVGGDQGVSGDIWLSTDYGVTWGVLEAGMTGLMSITSGGGVGGELGGNGSNLVVVTNLEGIYYSTDYGASWSSGDTGISHIFMSVVCSSDGATVYAYEVQQGTVWKSTNSGNNWTEITGGGGDPAGGGGGGFVACSADGIKVYLGSFVAGDEIYISNTSGSSGNWFKPTTIDDPYGQSGSRKFVTVACSKDGTIVWIGGYDNGIWKSTDSGANFVWSLGVVGQGGSASANGNQVWATSSTGEYVGASGNQGPSNVIVRYDAVANDWAITMGTTDCSINLVYFDDLPQKNISIGCDSLKIGATKTNIFGDVSFNDNVEFFDTINGNFHVRDQSFNFISGAPSGWTNVQAVPNVVDMAMSSDGTKQIATSRGGNIWYSSDSGQTWTESTSGVKNWWGCASDAAGDNMVAVVGTTSATGAIWRSTDSGVTWVETGSQPAGGDKRWVSITSGGAAGGVLGGDGTILVAVSYGDGIYFSSDSGGSWTEADGGAGENAIKWSSVVCSSTGVNVYASEYPLGRVWRSIDSGNNWIDISADPSDPSVEQGRVACSASGATVYAGTFAKGDEIYISLIFGISNSWNKPITITDPYGMAPNRRFDTVACSGDGATVWIGGHYNGIWKSTDTGDNFAWSLGVIGQGGSTVAAGNEVFATNLDADVIGAYNSRDGDYIVRFTGHPGCTLGTTDCSINLAHYDDLPQQNISIGCDRLDIYGDVSFNRPTGSGNLNIMMLNLPENVDGLPRGTLYNDGGLGILKIAP